MVTETIKNSVVLRTNELQKIFQLLGMSSSLPFPFLWNSPMSYHHPVFLIQAKNPTRVFFLCSSEPVLIFSSLGRQFCQFFIEEIQLLKVHFPQCELLLHRLGFTSKFRAFTQVYHYPPSPVPPVLPFPF